MKKVTLIFLVVAAALILAGGGIFSVAMAVKGWDFDMLNTSKYVSNSYTPEGDFQSIAVETDTADVVLAPASDGVLRVECYEEEKVQHVVTVADGVLSIKKHDTRKWYDHISFFHISTPRITVYLPKSAYDALTVRASTGDAEIPRELSFTTVDIELSTGDVRMHASASEALRAKTSTGKILLEGVSAGAIELSTSTGKITLTSVECAGAMKLCVDTGKTVLTDVACESLTSKGETGGIHLERVIAQECISIERDTGSVTFDACDAAEINVKTDTGDVKGSFLSDKIIFARSDTGKTDVPRLTSGGRCEIESNTGDIKITILQ